MVDRNDQGQFIPSKDPRTKCFRVRQTDAEFEHLNALLAARGLTKREFLERAIVWLEGQTKDSG